MKVDILMNILHDVLHKKKNQLDFHSTGRNYENWCTLLSAAFTSGLPFGKTFEFSNRRVGTYYRISRFIMYLMLKHYKELL